MWWWNNKVGAVVWIGAGRVEVRMGDKTLDWQVDAKLVKNLEVVDEAKLTEAWKVISEKCNLKGKRVAIVMGADTCFVKKVDLTALEHFWDEVPLSVNKMAKLSVPSGPKEVLAVATNRELFEIACETLEKTGAKVKAVVPGGAGGALELEKWLSVTDWKKIPGFDR